MIVLGLTHNSMGSNVNSEEFKIERSNSIDKVVALAGNPNVGKSTVFNALTGMNQHTGNWPGKTVSSASGKFKYKDEGFILVDLPGTYSIMSSSVEEEVARDFICFEEPDLTVVVADATSLERNLNLVLQILEITNKVVLCVNLLDEAKSKKITIDIDELSLQLGIPVVGTSAREKIGLEELKEEIYNIAFSKKKTFNVKISYEEEIEKAIELVKPVANSMALNVNERWLCLRLIEDDESFMNSLKERMSLTDEEEKFISIARDHLIKVGLDSDNIRDKIVGKLVERACDISSKCVCYENSSYNEKDRKIDKILTSKLTGIPIILLLLGFIFWLTIV